MHTKLHPTLLFVCSGETDPGAKDWSRGAFIVKGASPLTHSSNPLLFAHCSRSYRSRSYRSTYNMSATWRVLGLNHGFEYLVGPIALLHGPHLIL
ncbi:hypothetical protein DAPPUDRAFT_260873 [Daphnia pulex]|uniref:Uncharacterized protein n=1 Tax=Daphnia pulex TaxID=6669 RepID=E9HK06_DAPPU|nr:hypothetical protein DAPPUDRAFT_260873 [Daphnia pulex]|eukprot:EFX67931.1 hypothetical protein DAPPUDRAFT_260873 [Daphnia pulex]